jgi:hypothetical protein
MPEKGKQKRKLDLEKANEPMPVYSAGMLGNIFGSVEISSVAIQEEEMRNYSASLSHIQRMEYLYDLICRAYAHVLDNPSENLWDKTIYIDHT